MEEARVVIDLKEGIIELQGPVDFVRHYLEMYQPAMKGLRTASRKAAGIVEKPKRVSQRGRRGKRVSCTAAVRAELAEGFFDEAKRTGDIKQRLSEAGYEFSDSNVRNSLKRLTTTGVLSATGKGGTLTYSKPASS